MSRTEELEQQVQHLTRVIEDMKTRVVRLEAADEAVAEGDPPRKTRRNFLKLGAATALGAAGMLAGRAIPAAAADTAPAVGFVSGITTVAGVGDAGVAPAAGFFLSTFFGGSTGMLLRGKGPSSIAVW